MRSLLAAWTWPEWRHHPWRHAMALLAVAVGVALGFAVHLINASALAEFGAAVRAVNGQPDLELRGPRDGFDEQLYARVAADPDVALASPVVEVDTLALAAGDGSKAPARVPLRVLGIDALVVAPIAPSLLPRPERDDAQRTVVVDPRVVFLNAAARRRLGDPRELAVLAGTSRVSLRVAGSVAAEGAPLAVMDIAGAQSHFGRLGRLSRLDLRLVAGADRDAVLRRLALPAGVRAAQPDESLQRVSNLSRAYRVNLTVLALVALFVGGFLVFSVTSLSVAQRLPQLALLGVLGLSAGERQRLVMTEAAIAGALGSALGLALGTVLASFALRALGGDLGAGLLPGVEPRLQWSAGAAALYGALGVAATLVGAWQPAWVARRVAPAQALKGLGAELHRALPAWAGPALLGVGALLALAPPVGGLPWAAYASVALLLVGGIVCVPAGVSLLLARVPPPRAPLALLAIERARDQRHTATIAVAGVVASLALAVALTVMVASFRDSVTRWLDQVLPADLYARAAPSSAIADSVFLRHDAVQAAARLPGVARIETQRVAPLPLDQARPAPTLIARPLPDPAQRLPLVGELRDAPAGAVVVYVSEAVEALYGARAGSTLALPLPDGRRVDAFVRGVWRDYARQHGAIAIDAAQWRRLTGDERVNDLALWLEPGADADAVQAALRERLGDDGSLEFARPQEIRAASLAIFDRSFAVTYWLQAVAIGIGLVGVAASFSAQVLARRREFGLLVHLGFTRRQVLAVVGGEAAVWTAAGVAFGLALGLAVSVVLVHVVNPQSFHWTMQMHVPWARLAVFALVVLVAATATALLAARASARRDAVLAVKEDW